MTIQELLKKINNKEDYWTEISVKQYLTMKEKDFVVRRFMLKYSLIDYPEVDSVSISIQTEILYLFYILLSYTDLDVSEEDMTFNNYDTLKESGFVQNLKHKIGEDYYNLLDIAKHSISVKDISSISQVLFGFNPENFKEDMAEFKKMMETFDISELNKFLVFNNPLLKNVIK